MEEFVNQQVLELGDSNDLETKQALNECLDKLQRIYKDAR